MMYLEVRHVLKIVETSISAIGFLICALTWILIPKWRTFKNYVYTNILWSHMWSALPCLFEDMHLQIPFLNIIISAISVFGLLSVCCWVLIASLLCYSSLVTIFNATPKRRVLKSTIFAYGLPGVISLLYLCVNIRPGFADKLWPFHYVEILVVIVISTCSVLLYVRVVYSILRQKPPATQPLTNDTKCIKLQVATLALCTSGFCVLVPILTLLFVTSLKALTVVNVVIDLCFVFQCCAICVTLTCNKATRKLWREYFCKILDKPRSRSQLPHSKK